MSRAAEKTVVLAMLLAAACGDDGTTDSDDGGVVLADGATERGPADVVPDPATPPAPVEWACPAGWRSFDVGGADACEPWPDTGRETCTGASAHVPGTPGCAPIGPECPASGFATDLPSDRPLVFVDAAAAAGGDGSRTAPFATIGDALVDLAADSVVAIALGTYDEVVRPPAGVTLWGACADGTRIASTEASETAGTVSIPEAGVELRDVTVAGERAGIVVGAGPFHLQSVLIEDVAVVGLFVTGDVTVTGTDVVIRGTRSNAAGRLGRGMSVEAGARATLDRLTLDHNAEVGLVALEPATTVTLADVAITDGQGRGADGWFGRGLVAQGGPVVTAERIALEDNRHDCIFASGEGSRVSLTDAVVRGTQAVDTSGYFGSGSTAFTGAAIEVDRALFADNVSIALAATEPGSAVRATDVVAIDGRPVPDGRAGFGVQVRDRATGEITRGFFARHGQAGLVMVDEGSLTATDVVVRDGLPTPVTREDGRGVAASNGGHLELTRALVADNREAGIVLMTGSSGTLTDVRVEGTVLELVGDEQGRGIDVISGSTMTGERLELVGNLEGAMLVDGAILPDGTRTTADLRHVFVAGPSVDDVPAVAGRIFGAGITVQFQATVTLDSVLVEDALYTGLLASRAGARMEVQDVMVRGTAPVADGFWGHGVQVQRGAALSGRSLAVETATAFGLLASQLDTTVDLADVRVVGTRSRPCAGEPDCAAAGIGVTAAVGGAVTLDGFAVTDNALCGVQVVDADADLRHGVVARQPIGANVQASDFDYDRLTVDVAFVDNDRNLDTAMLPIPDETATFTSPES